MASNQSRVTTRIKAKARDQSAFARRYSLEQYEEFNSADSKRRQAYTRRQIRRNA